MPRVPERWERSPGVWLWKIDRIIEDLGRGEGGGRAYRGGVGWSRLPPERVLGVPGGPCHQLWIPGMKPKAFRAGSSDGDRGQLWLHNTALVIFKRLMMQFKISLECSPPPPHTHTVLPALLQRAPGLPANPKLSGKGEE